MADSNITKRALAAALKELMEEMPFSKISISDICSKCDMNRKSFYYHFKDKYDLVNWIFDNEFISIAKEKQYSEDMELISDVCNFLYENHSFYRKAFEIEGQNSFADHFHDLLSAFVSYELKNILIERSPSEFQISVFTDAFTLAIYKWIKVKDPMTPDEFLQELNSCLKYIANKHSE